MVNIHYNFNMNLCFDLEYIYSQTIKHLPFYILTFISTKIIEV